MSVGGGGFRGTERFTILREVGEGGMGVVYAVRDTQRNEVVALKTLRFADASAIYRLKKEFRSLADVAHPNLVALYELIGEADEWFFTMEFVNGVSFLQHVRPDVLNLNLLRAALAQLAEAVTAVHTAGRLHRDLKPSNVLVTEQGRVVVLDFGIASDFLMEQVTGHTVEEGIWGSALYMSPEQAEGQALPASDWYAVGVMLYEALTGQLPFTGWVLKVLADKAVQDPASPDTLVPGLPPDLVELCMALLARDPAVRPTGEEVLRRLGVSDVARTSDAFPGYRAEAVVVGRERHLAELDGAFDRAASGEATTVYVTGPSGMGKSTLVYRFLDRLNREGRAIVLTGRCYVRESVPYKGVDGVVDSLSRYLRGTSAEARGALMTPDLWMAARLFPVLGRVEQVGELPEPEQQILDVVQLRRRGVAALRALFGRLSTATPVVIHIDDLQWSDADSLRLLEALLAPPQPPALLVIANFRSEDVEANPLLRELLRHVDSAGRRHIEVGPLTEGETRRLVTHLLGAEAGEASRSFRAIVREAAGSPFLVEQLVRYLRASREEGRTGGDGVSLGEMLAVRMGALPADAQLLLSTLAVAAHPLDPVVARDAAGVSGDERPIVALLRTKHFVRASGVAARIEIYHDRMRETLVGGIERARIPEIHLRLASAMEAHGIDDPESLFDHYLAGDRPERAQPCAVAAGDRAAGALAFQRAAVFYRQALELLPQAGGEGSPLRLKLAEALANAGHGPEAADMFLAAVAGETALTAQELRRRAAEQLLRCGHVDRGLEVVQTVMAAAGLTLARSPRHALARILVRRAFLRLRGMRFRERPEAEIDPQVLSRIDVCWAVAIGLARVDNIRATDFQVMNLHLALRAGELLRIVRGLTAEAGFLATGGGPSHARASRLAAAARRMAERLGRPEAQALAQFASGFVNFWTGRFPAARQDCEAAERLFRERCTGVMWEINTAQTVSASSLFYLGEFAELARRVPARLQEAREHGDLYAAADVAAGRPNVVWLAAGDADAARAAIQEAMSPWSPRGFHLQHYFRLLAECHVDLYSADGRAAWERVRAVWPRLAGSMVLRVQLIRAEGLHLRARCALALARTAPDPAPYLRSAARDAQRVAREHMPWSDPLADLVRAAVAAARGETEPAAELAWRALAGFEATQLAAYAAAARRQYGTLIGGEAGRAHVAQADAWMAAQGVVDPTRFAAMLAPGIADPA